MCQRVHFAAAASGLPFQLAGQVVAMQQAVEVLSQSLCAAALIMIATPGARGSPSPVTTKAKRWVRVLRGACAAEAAAAAQAVASAAQAV